jgi:galactokinase
MTEVKAPGRICLFGEHQDYLGLPVIAAAITRFIFVRGTPISAREFVISLPDLGAERRIGLDAEAPYVTSRDYLASCFNVLRRQGCRWPSGFEVTVWGDIPQRAGVSSSSALVVAWMEFLLRAAEDSRWQDPGELARLGHIAEVVEFREPGGMMDHFAAAYRGLIYVDTRPPFACRRIAAEIPGIVLCYSGEPKATLEVLSRTRGGFTRALALVREVDPSIDPAATPIESMRAAASGLPPEERELLEAQWINAGLTAEGLAALECHAPPSHLGALLTAHHEQLRKLGVSTDRIDLILAAAREAGAVGGKVNGTGGGGCLFVLAPGREEAVVSAMEAAGGTAWPVQMAMPDV